MSAVRTRWSDDGWDAAVRIGVLTPHADVGPESELRAMAPAVVGIHAARVAFGAMTAGGGMDPTIPLSPVRAFAEPPHVDDAAEQLAAAPLQAIAFAFTSSAYVIGSDGEAQMMRGCSSAHAASRLSQPAPRFSRGCRCWKPAVSRSSIRPGLTPS